jgi:hypothetical protein
MSKMTKPLAILALVAVLGPAHAEPIDTATCEELSAAYHKLLIGLKSCHLPAPDGAHTPLPVIEFFARTLEGRCHEGAAAEAAAERLGEDEFQLDVARMGRRNACWRLKETLSPGK